MVTAGIYFVSLYYCLVDNYVNKSYIEECMICLTDTKMIELKPLLQLISIATAVDCKQQPSIDFVGLYRFVKSKIDPDLI